MSAVHGRPGKLALAALLAALGLLGALALKCAWVCDDAYISLRVADNLVQGFGPRWNVAERVQAFTHPLWLALVTPLYALSGEVYLTSIALGLATTLAAAGVLAFRDAKSTGGAAAALACLAGSKAFVDFATSGLENPLLHLCLALALVELARERPRTALACLWASLVALARLDALLLIAPALASHLWSARSRRTLGLALAGFAPLAAWEAFSFLYYGSFVPNTAYAKLSTGLAASELAEQGLRYLANSFALDPLTLCVIAAACALAAWRGGALDRAVAVGVALYLAYVVKIGGDFMSGRFLTAPLFCAALLLSRARIRWPAQAAIGIGALALALASPSSPIRAPLDYSRGLKAPEHIDGSGIADERGYWHAVAGLFASNRADTAKLHVSRGHPLARRWRAAGPSVQIGEGIGYLGYWAGPEVHIVDPMGLADAFLARLPIIAGGALVEPEKNRFRERPWRIGHYYRHVPAGYLASRSDPSRALDDPELEARRRRADVIARAPLLSAKRWHALLSR